MLNLTIGTTHVLVKEECRLDGCGRVIDGSSRNKVISLSSLLSTLEMFPSKIYLTRKWFNTVSGFYLLDFNILLCNFQRFSKTDKTPFLLFCLQSIIMMHHICAVPRLCSTMFVQYHICVLETHGGILPHWWICFSKENMVIHIKGLEPPSDYGWHVTMVLSFCFVAG